MKRRGWGITLIVLVAALCMKWPSQAGAHSIFTFNNSAISKGEFAVLFQTRYLRFTKDPFDAGTELNLFVFPIVPLFGATERLALFAVIPVIYQDLSISSMDFAETDLGVGDIAFNIKYGFLRKNWTGGSYRLEILGGIEIPTTDGSSTGIPFSSNSVDFPLGLVSTLYNERFEFDADVIYQFNTEGMGFDHGNALTYDASLSTRVYPWKLPEEVQKFNLNLVLEFNGVYAQKEQEIGGLSLNDTGGNELSFAPGLEFALPRYLIQLAGQIPIIQDLNGQQLKRDFTLLFGFAVHLGHVD